ncbi:hypothetical protein MUU53_01430 [Rhizobium lemnae]|uniref:Uncharacterized protein n=1 Tax=Rhizobium lemnae TaxID=1214924 RepID=A0ABV8E505_9HYPH|nr:hypothetical protein [Rhizobium lemnae]MCJ8506566.1 hypothetical protein [Rhizobium lemnae]
MNIFRINRAGAFMKSPNQGLAALRRFSKIVNFLPAILPVWRLSYDTSPDGVVSEMFYSPAQSGRFFLPTTPLNEFGLHLS